MYHDEYQVKLKALIQDKINGKEIVASSSETGGTVIDLMEALQKSIAQQKKPTPPKPRKTAKNKKDVS